eukprot:TRINITY_DN65715_c3_g15_i1.p1 TRINITY_DN65715_c3_g15~~TRINITY_DN65715_c3_g15_i1.p1  ORF type:complete len:944 (+),score=511.27 TRINITY_DN65715_c3_g15_i1:53-2884(+)
MGACTSAQPASPDALARYDADADFDPKKSSRSAAAEAAAATTTTTTTSEQVELDMVDELQREDEKRSAVQAKRGKKLSLPPYSEGDIALQAYQAKRGKRNSIVAYIESVRKIHNQQKDFLSKKRSYTMLSMSDRSIDEKVLFLARGGTYVKTSIGPIQFGLPPETIKDSMAAGLTLPSHFVMPKERFNLQMGLNVAEFEFPAYFNFFVLRKKVNLIITRDVEQVVRTIFQETLLGPKKIEFPDHYSPHAPREAYPDLARELAHFRRNPFNPAEELTVDTLIDFTYFDEDGVARLENGRVQIHDEGDEYVLYDEGVSVATINGYVILSPPNLDGDNGAAEAKDDGGVDSDEDIASPIPEETSVDTNNDSSKSADGDEEAKEQEQAEDASEEEAAADATQKQPLEEERQEEEEEEEDQQSQAEEEETAVFSPPQFGITMLGNSHGFDAGGTTTGFVVWMNRRGIMVDPPPHSGAILKQHGIPSRLVHSIILTHCHADHDAGTFQKILEEGRIELHTTPVILGSFMRKYSAISGLDQSFLAKLFEFRPVTIGERITVYGGQLRFFYSLHSIPCVGFEAFSSDGEHSMVYSGDTFNDRDGIVKLYESGVLSAGRRDQLINFPWHHSVILHEAGVPPIHTPMKTLTSLPQDVKDRLYVVHTKPSDLPPDLKPAAVGPQNTIVISNEINDGDRALEVLDLVSNIDLFENFPITRAPTILQCSTFATYPRGHILIEQGSTDDDVVYVIAMGVVSVEVDGNLIKHLTVGDHFGEMALVTGKPRTATIRCDTECHLVQFNKEQFMLLVQGTDAIDRLKHLGIMQTEESWQVISSNTVLGKLSSSQKTYLQSILHKRDLKRGEVLWEAGEEAKMAVIVQSGLFLFARAKQMAPFKRGAFIGESRALLHGTPLQTTLVCGQDGSLFYVTKADLLKFFDDNPGTLVLFKDLRFVE